MIFTQPLGNIHKIRIPYEIRSLYITISPSSRPQNRHRPAILQQSGGKIKCDLIVTVISHTVWNRTSGYRICRIRHDIDRSPDRRHGHFRRSQSSLHLYKASNISQTRPIRPIDTSPFHLVHRYSVHHHRYILRLESPQINPSVSKRSPLFRGVNTRQRFQYLREFLCWKFLLDLFRRHYRQGYRGLPVHG